MPLSRGQRLGLWALLGAIIAFGGIVEMRSVFLARRMGDLTVFVRAAWAVRTGENIYQVSDERNGWYYVYPPLFAILMTPLAEPPPGSETAGFVPFPISVAVWYLLSVAFLFWGVHQLATALEETSIDPHIRTQRAGCQRWWAIRLVPIYTCLIPIGSTLSHAQTNLLILAMLCGMLAALVRGKRFQAGLWMAGPICMKVFPALFLVYPLWRRDLRCLGGCAVGLFIGLLAVPGLVFGPARTVDYYHEFADLVLLPGIGKGDNQARAETLTAITATDTQSFMAMMHNALHPDVASRPPNPDPAVRLIHWGFGAALILTMCCAAGWRPSEDRRIDVVFVSVLILLMMFLSPVCHLPYFAWVVPIVMVLLFLKWEHGTEATLGWRWGALLSLNFGVHLLAELSDTPQLRIFKDLGLTTVVGLAIGGVGVFRMYQATGPGPSRQTGASTERRAAA